MIWFPLMVFVGALSVLNIYFAQEISNFQSLWLNKLQSVLDYYPCTDASLGIDLDYFDMRRSSNEQLYYIILMISNCAIVITSVSQFLTHAVMMLRWYKENPKDG